MEPHTAPTVRVGVATSRTTQPCVDGLGPDDRGGVPEPTAPRQALQPAVGPADAVPLQTPAAPQRVASARVTGSRRRSEGDLAKPDAALRDRRDPLAAWPRVRGAGAFSVFVDLEDTGLRSATFAWRLVRRAGVTTSSSVGFGPRGEEYVRPSSAPRAELGRGTTRIRGALRRLPEAPC